MIRAYFNKYPSQIGFAVPDEHTTIEEADICYVDIDTAEEIIVKEERFYRIKTVKKHIKVGSLRYNGKKETYFTIFFPREWAFMFWGIKKAEWGEVVHNSTQGFGVVPKFGGVPLNMEDIVDKHRNLLSD